MARMYADDLQTALRSRLGNPPDEDMSDDDLLRILNLTQIEMASLTEIPELHTYEDVTLVASTAEYELSATDVMWVLYVEVTGTGGRELYGMDRQDYIEWTQGNAGTGTPTNWALSQVGSNQRPKLLVWPTPASGDAGDTVRVWYQKVPTELVTSPNANHSDFRQSWDPLLLDAAVVRGFRHLRMWDDAAQAEKAVATSNALETRRVKGPEQGRRLSSALHNMMGSR